MKRCFALVLALCLAISIPALGEDIPKEVAPMSSKNVPIAYMTDWPQLPTPFHIRDWAQTAKDYYLLTLNPKADALQFPLAHLIEFPTPTSGGYVGKTLTMNTYLMEDNKKDHYGEAVTIVASILGASLTEGIDPRDLYGMDYVDMASFIFQRTPSGDGFISNNGPGDDCTSSFWYTLYPTVLFFQLAAQYPEDEKLTGMMREVADTWLKALPVIGGDWDNMGFSLKNMALIEGGHTEPEGVYGVAYIEYMAYLRFGDEKYLAAANRCMAEAQAMARNPYYEVLGSYAPYLAARMAAEGDGSFSLERFLNWVFTDGKNAARPSWGITKENWGGYDAYGLSGSLSDTSGYAFAMNTFITAGAVAPIARYAPQYSKSIGQYLLAVANNANMYFGDGLPLDLQDDAAYVEATGIGYLCYEGVRNLGKTTPFGTGDVKIHFPGTKMTNFSFYSGGPMGLFTSLVAPTNVPEILRFDITKTDFEKGECYPTYLYYNPLETEKTIQVAMPHEGDLYNILTMEYLARDAKDTVAVSIGPDEALQLAILPAGTEVTQEGLALMAGDIVVGYQPFQVYTADLPEGTFVKEPLTIALKAVLPEGDPVSSFTAEYAGNALYQGSAVPEALTLAPSAMGTGAGELLLTTVLESGARSVASYWITSFDAGEAVLALDGQGILNLGRPQGGFRRSGLEDGMAWFYMDSGSSLITTDWLELDLSREPVLVMDMDSALGNWGIKCYIAGNDLIMQSDTRQAGGFIYNIRHFAEKNGYSAEEPLRMRFRPFFSGSPGEYYIHSMGIYYTK